MRVQITFALEDTFARHTVPVALASVLLEAALRVKHLEGARRNVAV